MVSITFGRVKFYKRIQIVMNASLLGFVFVEKGVISVTSEKKRLIDYATCGG